MKTLLLPTTTGVNESISMREALSILSSNGISFEIVGDVVDGMYLSESGEIVSEELLPIHSNIGADELAQLFTQECILESDDNSARLVAQNGDIWAKFTEKVEYHLNSLSEAINLQEKLARHFGGASRVGNFVWAWGTKNDIEKLSI